MYKVEIQLKTALDLTNGPTKETLYFDSMKEIKNCFTNFNIKDDKIYKKILGNTEIVIGTISLKEDDADVAEM